MFDMLKRLAIALCCGIVGYVVSAAVVLQFSPASECGHPGCGGAEIVQALFAIGPLFGGIGFLLALLLTRLMASLLHDVAPTDLDVELQELLGVRAALTVDVPFDRALFEATSAFATVGLSTGITPDLPPSAQTVLVILMYVGRVGTIAVGTAIALNTRRRQFRYPEERPLVG